MTEGDKAMVKTLQEINREFMFELLVRKPAKPGLFDRIFNRRATQQRIVPDPRRQEIHVEDSFPQQPAPSVQHPQANAAARNPLWKDFLFLATKIAVIILAFVLLFALVFGIERYEDPSMSPSIKYGDLVIYHRYTNAGYLPQDTIMLEYNGQVQARRVIATAGDVVDITKDGLMINDSLQQEAYIHQKTERYADGVSFPLTVPDGHVFVLSDSRHGATDSRVYGSVSIDDTLGKVIAVIRQRSI